MNDPLKKLFDDSFPADAPRPELAERVAGLKPVTPHRGPWIAVGSLAAAASVATVIVIVSAPKTALADEILRQAKNIHGHVLQYRIDSKGVRTLQGEGWIEENRLRFKMAQPDGVADGQDTVIDAPNHVNASWNPRIRMFAFGEGDSDQMLKFANLLVTGTPGDFLKRLAFKPASAPVTGRATFHGSAADFVDIPRQDGHLVIYADPETHKILGIHSRIVTYGLEGPPRTVQFHSANQAPTGPSYVDDVEQVFDDQVADPDIFKPIFDIDGLKVDAYKRRSDIQAQLSKPLATYSVLGASVALRDVSRNRDGDVFVLFTQTGKYAESTVIPAEVKDDDGGVYSKAYRFSPWWVNTGAWSGYSFGGKPLQGYWFAHVAGRPTLGPVRIGFRRLFGGSPNLVLTSHKLPAQPSGELPGYMPLMRIPLSLNSMLRDTEQAKAEYFVKSGDLKRAEAAWRKIVADQERRQSEAGAMTYFRFAQCLEREGKFSEAIAVLKKSKSASIHFGSGMDSTIDHEIRLAQKGRGTVNSEQ